MDWEIKLIEECPDEIAAERERFYYDTLKPWFNDRIPGRTQNECRKAWRRRLARLKAEEL